MTHVCNVAPLVVRKDKKRKNRKDKKIKKKKKKERKRKGNRRDRAKEDPSFLLFFFFFSNFRACTRMRCSALRVIIVFLVHGRATIAASDRNGYRGTTIVDRWYIGALRIVFIMIILFLITARLIIPF